jgi:predicted dehydrogenase
VICQKPLAPTLAEAEAMTRACEDAGVPLMVHENFRWQRPMRALRERSARLGGLFFGRISFRTPYDVYADQPYLATDARFIIADLGVHLLDLARFFFGEAAQLTCLTQRINPRIQGEDVATILLTMESGATCLVDMSYASRTDPDIFPQTLVHLEGREGSATLHAHYALTTVAEGKTEHVDVSPHLYAWSSAPGQAIQESVVAIQRHWIDCLRAGTSPETTGKDNLKTLELVFGAYESAEQGRPYRVRKTR